MMLEKHAVRIRTMADDFVHALAPLGILLIGRQEARTNSLVVRRPAFAAVISAIHTAGRDRDVHSFSVRRIRKNGVQAEPSTARLPLCAMWMIEQAAIQRPGIAAVS